MSELSKLYGDWNNEHTDSPEVQKAWERLGEFIEKQFPAAEQSGAEQAITSYAIEIEQQGFIGGFKKATAIWCECMGDKELPHESL